MLAPQSSPLLPRLSPLSSPSRPSPALGALWPTNGAKPTAGYDGPLEKSLPNPFSSQFWSNLLTSDLAIDLGTASVLIHTKQAAFTKRPTLVGACLPLCGAQFWQVSFSEPVQVGLNPRPDGQVLHPNFLDDAENFNTRKQPQQGGMNGGRAILRNSRITTCSVGVCVLCQLPQEFLLLLGVFILGDEVQVPEPLEVTQVLLEARGPRGRHSRRRSRGRQRQDHPVRPWALAIRDLQDRGAGLGAGTELEIGHPVVREGWVVEEFQPGIVDDEVELAV